MLFDLIYNTTVLDENGNSQRVPISKISVNDKYGYPMDLPIFTNLEPSILPRIEINIDTSNNLISILVHTNVQEDRNQIIEQFLVIFSSYTAYKLLTIDTNENLTIFSLERIIL